MLSSSERSQIRSPVSVGATEDSKEEGSTSKDQEAAELEEKLPDQTEPTKEVSGGFLTWTERKEVQQYFFHPTAVLNDCGTEALRIVLR